MIGLRGAHSRGVWREQRIADKRGIQPEVLFDELPGGRRLGGAPLNFAYHLLRLGWPAHLVTRVGRDADGRAIRERLQAAGFDARTIQVDSERPTGTVSVQLDGSGVPTGREISPLAGARSR